MSEELASEVATEGRFLETHNKAPSDSLPDHTSLVDCRRRG
jgi:hypothetical protein